MYYLHWEFPVSAGSRGRNEWQACLRSIRFPGDPPMYRMNEDMSGLMDAIEKLDGFKAPDSK
jgi:hypothetical protein